MSEKTHSCNTCLGMRQPTKIQGTSVGYHCIVHTVNYYANDKSQKPRQAYLAVHPDEGPCAQYASKGVAA